MRFAINGVEFKLLFSYEKVRTRLKRIRRHIINGRPVDLVVPILRRKVTALLFVNFPNETTTRLYQGGATCSEKDQFIKETGRTIALSNLLHTCIVDLNDYGIFVDEVLKKYNDRPRLP